MEKRITIKDIAKKLVYLLRVYQELLLMKKMLVKNEGKDYAFIERI